MGQVIAEIPQGITQTEIDQRVFDLYDEYCQEDAAKLVWDRTIAFFKKHLA